MGSTGTSSALTISLETVREGASSTEQDDQLKIKIFDSSIFAILFQLDLQETALPTVHRPVQEETLYDTALLEYRPILGSCSIITMPT